MDDMSLKVSASPHVRSKDTTSDIMFDVIIALVPATLFGIWQFGRTAAFLIIACILSCVAFEALYQWGMKKKITISDCSAVVTGLLLALNLPPNLPIWMAVLGSAFAIIIVKQIFGGLGQNFMNPALGARCFLLLTFGRFMTSFVLDGVSTATPLARVRMGLDVDLKDMFWGYTAGTIGETSVIALLIGAFYLLIKKVISPRIPVFYIGTFALCIAVYAAVKDMNVLEFTLIHLCGGGLMLGAWFMATDYVTSPITPKGKIIFGIILGLLTFVLRIYGNSAEGVSYAIIFSNLLVPLIEKATVPKSFGQGADTKNNSDKKDEKTSVEEDTKPKTDEIKSKDKFDGKAVAKAIAAIFVITLIMGGALGLVYNITKEPIEKANKQAVLDAYELVYPSAEKVVAKDEMDYDALNEALHQFSVANVCIDEFAVALNESGEGIGYVITATNSKGYGGDIKMMIGIDFNGIIQGISFLELNETVGFGMEAENPEFISQFVGKDVVSFQYTKNGSDKDGVVDALSGATVTTSAVVDSVNTVMTLVILLGGGE